jgi:hypothetical protein
MSFSGFEYRKRKSRNGSVGIATGYGPNYRRVGVRVPVVWRMFMFPWCPDQPYCPPNLLSNGYKGQSGREREADHSPPAIAEVKENYTFTLQVFMA